MTSKNLFFKLMKEDLKQRLWVLALVVLALFFTFPISAVFMAGEDHEYMQQADWIEKYTESIATLVGVDNGWVGIFIVVAALLCAMTSFSYINSKRRVDFYHSIPVCREKLYLANFLNGILILAIPYAICLIISIVIASANGASGSLLWCEAGMAYALYMIYFFLIYATAVVVMMLTGSGVVGFFGCMVFFFYLPLLAMLVEGYFQTFFQTYISYEYAGLYSKLSPIFALVSSLEHFDNLDTSSLLPLIGSLIGAFVAAVLFAIAGMFLYHKRPSEAAGKAMAFQISKPIVRVMLVILSALALGIFGWTIRDSMGWAIFCLICGCVLCHCIVEIIYNFDFKKLFSHKFQLLGCAIVSIVILCGFRYDWIGYDRYLPKEEQVESVSLHFGALDNWVEYGTAVANEEGEYYWNYQDSERYIMKQMKLTEILPVLEIASAAIVRIQENLEYKYYSIEENSVTGMEEQYYTGFLVQYRLTSGRKVRRRYYLPLSSVMDPFTKIYQDPDYKIAAYPILSREAKDLSYVNYEEDGMRKALRNMTEEERNSLFLVYQKELALLEVSTRQKEIPVAKIEFVDKHKAEIIGRGNLTNKDKYYWRGVGDDRYPIYPSFTETIACLEKQGLKVGRESEAIAVDEITIAFQARGRAGGDTKEYYPSSILITDPDEIKELRKLCFSHEYFNMNLLGSYKSDLTVIMDFPQEVMPDRAYENNSQREFYFREGQIPEFLKEKLRENGWEG